MKNIEIIAQAFYGNRTGTRISPAEIDHFILGYLDNSIPIAKEKIDRTIILLPNTHNVLIYNKHQEEQTLEDKKRAFAEDGYVMTPLAAVPELNLEVYSRCIVCGVADNGELTDAYDDSKTFEYLAY